MREVLSEKPKVGDKLTFIGESNYLTKGRAYTVVAIDSDGNPYIYDDDGDREYLGESSYGNFEIELEMPKTNGILEVCVAAVDLEELAENGEMFIEVRVNAEGFALLEDLAKAHEKATRAGEIQAEIQRLQDELKGL